MQADLLPFIDWTTHPRRVFAPGARIIMAGDPTEMLFLLEDGVAEAPHAALNPRAPADGCGNSGTIRYEAGSLLSLLEMLALEHYRHDVLARQECRVISISRSLVKAMWDRDSRLAWPLSCSIAAALTQNRELRLAN